MRLFQDITLGQYMPGDSLLHSLDPRTKKVSLILLIVTIFSVDGLYPLLAIGLLIGIILKLSSLPAAFVLRGVGLFFWLFAFTALFHLFFTPGDPISPFPLWGVTVTRQGLFQGTTIFMQLFAVILLANIFSLTTSPGEITLGLEKSLAPFKRFGVRPEEVSLMVSLIIRFIPILKEETIKIVNAQKARGVNFDRGGVAKRAGNVVSIFGPLFSGIFARADNLALSMESRGFVSGRERGRYRELTFRMNDFFALMSISAFAILIFIKY